MCPFVDGMFAIVRKCKFHESDKTSVQGILSLHKNWEEVQKLLQQRIEKLISVHWRYLIPVLVLIFPLGVIAFINSQTFRRIKWLVYKGFAIPKSLKETVENRAREKNIKRGDFLDGFKKLIESLVADDEKEQIPKFKFLLKGLSNVIMPMIETPREEEEIVEYLKVKKNELENSLKFMDLIMQSLALQRLHCLFKTKV